MLMAISCLDWNKERTEQKHLRRPTARDAGPALTKGKLKPLKDMIKTFNSHAIAGAEKPMKIRSKNEHTLRTAGSPSANIRR